MLLISAVPKMDLVLAPLLNFFLFLTHPQFEKKNLLLQILIYPNLFLLQSIHNYHLQHLVEHMNAEYFFLLPIYVALQNSYELSEDISYLSSQG